MGRDPKLTPELQDEIVELIEKGAYLETACESVGITFQTYKNWMRWGGEGNQKEPYRSFFAAVTRARAQAELDHLAIAVAGDEGGSHGPSASAKWYLERTRSNRYAAQLRVKLEALEDLLMSDVDGVCAGKDCGCYEELLARFAARIAGDREALTTESESASEATTH